MSPDSTVVSCPGKVLLAGGYLVLEPENAGLVVGTASRFYTVVRDAVDPEQEATTRTAGPSRQTSSRRIKVHSPQFLEATWTYNIIYGPGAQSVRIEQVTDGSSRNTFVQDALEAALKVSEANHKRPKSDLVIDIVGDNDFYSQERTSTSDIPPFAKLGTTLSKVHKTGLGSSAAMVSSLVSALLIHLSDSSTGFETNTDQVRLLHNTAQYAHSRAQGKVGSGFDVSAAIYGSQIYHRFSPSCLQALLDAHEPTPSELLDGLSPNNHMWKSDSSTAGRIRPFTLPPFTTMLLADVDAGSNTPSMVRSVLKWRANDPNSSNLWTSIADSNERLATIFGHLTDVCKDEPSQYTQTIQSLSRQKSAQWTRGNAVETLLCDARDCIGAIRQGMKKMGELSTVPIEPDEQTRLLDSMVRNCTGVVGAGVPGAGGYDALWVLVLDPEVYNQQEASETEQQIGQLWADWDEMSVKALSASARIKGTQGATERTATLGLQLHCIGQVAGLEAVLQDI